MNTLDKKRVFMVEDNPGNRAVAKMILELSGAVTASSRLGFDALKLLEAFAPVDVILLDLMLPNGVSGYDLFDMIRKVPAYADVPIAAISAADSSHELPKVRERGFAGFIAKPLEADLFPTQILKIINGTPVWYTGRFHYERS
jgi:CheY-like chemotaxis protein